MADLPRLGGSLAMRGGAKEGVADLPRLGGSFVIHTSFKLSCVRRLNCVSPSGSLQKLQTFYKNWRKSFQKYPYIQHFTTSLSRLMVQL